MGKNTTKNTFKTSLLVGYFILCKEKKNTMFVSDKKVKVTLPKKNKNIMLIQLVRSFCYAA